MMFTFIKKHKINILLWLFVLVYIAYFSYLTIVRYKTLYAHYYDLGIMNQTAYNTYKAIQTGNFAGILELTDPINSLQIKRMAIHNDILLAVLALFYFIYAGPETLLVLQTVVLGLGAVAVFGIARHVFAKYKSADIISLIFSISYLLYPPMQRANIFDFHPVTLSTTLLLFMFLFWLKKKYLLSIIFLIISLSSKEQVGLTTFLFGIYALLPFHKLKIFRSVKGILTYIKYNQNNSVFALSAIGISIFWVVLSFLFIIPRFRGGDHFALPYYGDFGNSPIAIVIGIFRNPYSLSKYIFRADTFNYFLYLLGPVGFLSILSPLLLLIALPEFAINLLSNSWNMRNIIFHYTSVITPFVFISAIYGANKISGYRLNGKNIVFYTSVLILFFSFAFQYFKGPLPFMKEQDIHPFKYPQPARNEVAFWANTLRNRDIKISATGQVAPHFSSRKYLYLFSESYPKADYVVIRPGEIYNYPEKDQLIPVYEKLVKDNRFEKIYQSKEVEVYKYRKNITSD